MPKQVNSYDPDAPLPGIGSIWVWEIDSPDARELIEVVDVFWNGEEWWVESQRLRTRSLAPEMFYPAHHHNDVGRFWEACTPVRQTRTARPPLVTPVP